MFFCHFTTPRDANPSGKFMTVSQRRLRRVDRKEHRGWTYEVTRRKVGVTIRRDQYSVSIWWRRRAFSQCLAGFPSVQAAREAAIRRIDAIEDRPGKYDLRHTVHGPHRQAGPQDDAEEAREARGKEAL